MNKTTTTKLNLSQTYRKTICKIAKIPEEDFEYYYLKAMMVAKKPENIATIAAIMKKLYKKDNKV